MTMKDYFFSHHRPPTIRHFFPLGRCDCRWLRNDFSIPCAPENMSHKNIITIHFHVWTWYTPTILISRACHGFSIKIFWYSYPRWTSQNFELVHINQPVQNFGPPAGNFGPPAGNFGPPARIFGPLARIFGPPKTEFARREWRKMLGLNVAPAPNRSANYTKICSQLVHWCIYNYFFIAYHIKTCFWLQFNRFEPRWSSGCVRNRQGSGTKYRLSRCKHCIKMLPTSGRFRHIPGPQNLSNTEVWTR